MMELENEYEFRVEKRYIYRQLSIGGLCRDTVDLHFDHQGVHTIEIDFAHVEQVSTYLSREVFEEYEMIYDPIQVSVKKFKEALTAFDMSDELRIVVKEYEFNQPKIEVESSGTWSEFSCEEVEKKDEHTYPSFKDEINRCKVEISNEDLRQIAVLTNKQGDFLEIVAREGRLEMETCEAESGVDLKHGISIEKEFRDYNGPAKSIYAVGNIYRLSKRVRKERDVVLMFGDEYPICIYGYGTKEKVLGYEYILAPRLDEDWGEVEI